MNSQVILAFDSGIGGLSALGPLLAQARGLEIFYFGDLAHLPYGSKSPETVRTLVKEGFLKLLEYVEQKAKTPQVAVIACNTASAVALDVVEELSQLKNSFPVFGVIEAGSRAVLKGKGKRILGTQGTVRSEAYLQMLQKLGTTKPIIQKACPLFVPLVEENMLQGPATEWIVDHYLKDILREGDDVVLGCTHYPFLRTILEKQFPQASFYDAGAALKELGTFGAGGTEKNKIHFLFSDDSVSSMSLSDLLLKCGILDVEWSQLRL